MNKIFFSGFPVRINSIELDVPMHYKFEINLIIRQIIGPSPKGSAIRGWGWMARRKHLKDFLEEYHLKYKRIPTGIHDIGKTKALNIQMGIINFGDVSWKAIQDLMYKDYLNTG